MTDQHAHLWWPDAKGEVRAEQGCAAEPTPEEAARAIADAETRAAIRVELDRRPAVGQG